MGEQTNQPNARPPDFGRSALQADGQRNVGVGVIESEAARRHARSRAVSGAHAAGIQVEADYRSEPVAPFDAATTLRVQETALGAFRAIGGRDYARVDVMVRPNGQPVVLEVNTLPGMTETSLLPKAAAAAGIAFPELCQRMIDLAMQRPAPVSSG